MPCATCRKTQARELVVADARAPASPVSPTPGLPPRGDEEGVGERARLAILRYLALLHRLEQRALGLGRCAVDLVGEYHGIEDRSRVEAERQRPLVIDRQAEDVRGQQVARELHACVI